MLSRLFHKKRSLQQPETPPPKVYGGSINALLPDLATWKIDYHLSFRESHFNIEISNAVVIGAYVHYANELGGDNLNESDQRTIEDLNVGAGRLRVWINTMGNNKELEERKTGSRIGYGWREIGNGHLIKIYLTTPEIHDLIAIMNTDYKSQEVEAYNAVADFFEQTAVGTMPEGLMEVTGLKGITFHLNHVAFGMTPDKTLPVDFGYNVTGFST